MKMILASFAVLFFSNVGFASEVETVGVSGMVCSFCAQGITKKFKDQPEIADVVVSLENKFVKLTYKDGQKLSQDKIKTLLKEAGYDVTFNK